MAIKAPTKKRKSSIDLDIVKSVILKNNGEYICGEYINNVSKITMKCKEGHVFQMDYLHLNRNQWCPYCAPNRKVTPKQILDKITEFGGKLLNEIAKPYGEHELKVECGCGEKFSTTAYRLLEDRWCPHCKYDRGWESRKNISGRL